MKFFLLALLIPLFAHAGNGSGNVSEIVNTSIPAGSNTAGGGSVLPLGDITSGAVYQIYAWAVGNASPTFYAFYKNGVAFTVASGHKAYCISGTIGSTSANQTYELGAATAAVSGGTGAPTGGVYQCGSHTACSSTSATANAITPMAGPYMFDGTSGTVYPFLDNVGGGGAGLWASMTCTTI